MTSERPNILLIVTDQHRGDCLGCDGHPVVQTPNLDHLAAEGTRFRHAYSACPSCIPARATLLTGMDQWNTGLLGEGPAWGQIRTDYPHTLPGELAKGGYHTQGIGKLGFTPVRALNGFHNTILDEFRMDRPGLKADYKLWFERQKTESYGAHDHALDLNSYVGRPSHLPEHLHATYWTAQQAIEFLDRRDPEKPFFLQLGFLRPHGPYDPPQYFYQMYKDREIPLPHRGEWAAVHDDPAAGAKIDAWRGRRPDEQILHTRACYYGNITFIDHQIGRLLMELYHHHREAWANTLIMFISDHGDMLGDHHLWRKTHAYEGSSRIPMIVRLPRSWGAPGGQINDEVVELRDVMPTLLGAAGVSIPKTCQGRSMLPILRGRKARPWRKFLHGEHGPTYDEEPSHHFLTDGREKYIWFPYTGIEQLFDLSRDPGECHDLAGEPRHKPRVEHWRKRLIESLSQRSCGLVKKGRLQRIGSGHIVTNPYHA